MIKDAIFTVYTVQLNAVHCLTASKPHTIPNDYSSECYTSDCICSLLCDQGRNKESGVLKHTKQIFL